MFLEEEEVRQRFQNSVRDLNIDIFVIRGRTGTARGQGNGRGEGGSGKIAKSKAILGSHNGADFPRLRAPPLYILLIMTQTCII